MHQPDALTGAGGHYTGGMAKDAAEILRSALALPPESRAALIDSLVESLDREPDAAIAEAWRAEMERRVQELESGNAELVRWDEVERRLRLRLPAR